MTSTASSFQIPTFLSQIAPFDQLGVGTLQAIASKCQLLRYRTGQPIFLRESMPTQVAILAEGRVRILGYDQRSQNMVSLRLAEPGEVLGWSGLVRGVPTETAIASTEAICIILSGKDFLECLDAEPAFHQTFRERGAISEVFELMSLEMQRRADGVSNLKDLTLQVWPETVAVNFPKGKPNLAQLNRDRLWLISHGDLGEHKAGSRLPLETAQTENLRSVNGVRLLGIPYSLMPGAITVTDSATPTAPTPQDSIPYAPDRPIEPQVEDQPGKKRRRYPFVRGRGSINGPLACFQMLARHMGLSFRRDRIKSVLESQQKTAGRISLQLCGQICAMMGLNAQLVQLPATTIPRVKAPAMIRWKDGFALLYSMSKQEIVIAAPHEGILRKTPEKFAELWGAEGQVLLLEAPAEAVSETFSFWWFLPALMQHKKVLFEVLVASFFVQLFGLANPIITQVIIDKVLVQRSIETLDILGIFLLGVALFEALLNSLRTYLFVDTTNRIDLGLGSQVIDHLLRLPLKYFDNRRVGELAGRFHELENIRQFLTGTALTVVLDAVFSVLYIAIMLSYSGMMTLVALSTVPLFTILIVFVSPIVQRLLRIKAERYADTQSYLVEVLSGIQTVKAQNIELKSRWQWYQRYARYISAGFKTVLTSTTAGSVSGFLNKLSGLLLLWVGAHLVLKNEMSLGQLIAFRIIASNVTGSLLRFVQIWQTFQETAMSVERLRDILEATPEADEDNRSNIPLPEVKGAVKFENVSFRFNNTGPLQLANVTLEFQAGQFVGIVGQSGSGKSTLMKLLQRLYEPTAGRVQVDGYDISKVELYSLRRQVGVVLQDTLLFNGTVQDNISLTNPDATTEEIIEAAKIAVAHDFIMELPNGYNTVVGERGSSLSGGQRQRLAIARTVLQNPHLLILDEATSALDYNSERQVCNNLAVAFKNRTVFFITHRLSTVRNADVILMMDQGSVVEQGTHDELMALKGHYYCLYQQQESQL